MIEDQRVGQPLEQSPLPQSPSWFVRGLLDVAQLLMPQLKEERGHLRKNNSRAPNLGMAGWAKRDHEVKERLSGNAMMDHDGPLATPGRSAHTTTVSVALQDLLTQAAEIFIVLALQCVAGRAKAMSEYLFVPASAVHSPLHRLHFPAPSIYR